MAHFYLGDEPGGELLVAPSSIDDAADYPEAIAEMRAPSGLVVPLAAAPVPGAEVPTVAVQLAGLNLAEPGVWRLELTLVDSTEGAERMRSARPVRVPVEDAASPWHTIDSARAEWAGAPSSDPRLFDLLTVARDQVLAFAPTPDPLVPFVVPEHYRAAQLMQARNIWNAQAVEPGATSYGGEGFAVRVYPLDWAVKQMIRPQSGTPRVG